MKLYFLIPEHDQKSRLVYCVQVIANILGYPWKMISVVDTECETGILISYSTDTSTFSSHRIPEINIYNSDQLYDLQSTQKDLQLFEYGGYTKPLLGKKRKVYSPDWKENKQFKYYHKSHCVVWLTEFDLFVNVFYHLSRFEEQGRRTAQETVTDHAASILSGNNQLNIPLVDVLISYFDQLIRLKIIESKQVALRVMNWPGGEESGVAFTHDIDLTRGVSFKKRFWKYSTAVIRKILGNREVLTKCRMEIKQQDDLVWSYPQLLDFYHRRKWKATFFFLAKKFEGFHYRYNIKSPKFQSLFENLKSDTHEIGLHSSLNAFAHKKRYAAEKRKLEQITGIKCAGLRQHYLRALYPGLWELAEGAHFTYDSSIGYNFQPGFRAGTSHPFLTYDWKRDQPLTLLEFPLSFFEYNVLTDSADMSSAWSIIHNIITHVLQFHGLLVILLHPSNLLQPVYRELWNYLIAEVDKQRMYVDTLSGLYKWFKFKEHIELSAEKKNNTEETWTIKKPVGLRIFSIEIIGEADLRIPTGVQIDKISDHKYTINTDKSKLDLLLYRR